MYYCVLEFFKGQNRVKSSKFDEDESVLGRLFAQLYELMSNITIHSELEPFPILMFCIFLQPVTTN
jgi:hypothetical protein